VASGSAGAAQCPVCSAEVPGSDDGSTEASAGPREGAQADRARAPSAVATDDEPRHADDRTWERLIDEMMPVPWDERDRTFVARALDTLAQVSLRPVRFFRAMATDEDSGATRLALASFASAALGLAWVLTGLVVGAGSTVSPVVIGLEVWVVSALALALLGAFRAGVTAVALRLAGRRLRGLRRVASFAAVPMLLGLIPVLGLIAGLALGARAFASGLRVRYGVSTALAWALALAPAPALGLGLVVALLAAVGAA